MSFIPTGYTPARNIPVRNLSGIAAARLLTKKASSAVHVAAHRALAVSRCCGLVRSARLKTVEVTAPATKPICTVAVSQTAVVDPIPHSERRLGTTAVAENQALRLSTWTSATSARCWFVRDGIISAVAQAAGAWSSASTASISGRMARLSSRTCARSSTRSHW